MTVDRNAGSGLLGKGRAFLELLATIAVIAVCAVFLWQRTPFAKTAAAAPTRPTVPRGDAPLPTAPIPIADSAVLGNSSAKAVMIIYSDFQCPFCRKFAEDSFAEIRKEFVDSGRLLIAFNNFPIAEIHKSAVLAAETAECARQQGKFWPLHDLMFSSDNGLAMEALRGYARQIGLNTPELEACLPNAQTRIAKALNGVLAAQAPR